MKTIDIEITVMKWLDIRKNLVVPNVSGWRIRGIYHECDILSLTKSGYATEIEIKISKSDLLKDKQKPHGHHSYMIKYLYFAVPDRLKDYALEHIPARSGLLTIRANPEYLKVSTYGIHSHTDNRKHLLTVERKPVVNSKAHKWTDEQRIKLSRLGAMRILGLKQKIA